MASAAAAAVPREKAAPVPLAEAPQPPPQRSPYIVGARYDWALFLLPPLAALGVGVAISGTPFSERTFPLFGQRTSGAGLLIGTLIHAHLVAVLFRSHANAAIRRLHPLRFLLVPPLVWAAIRFSPVAAAAALVLATFWDVWHSGLQTFGLGRIYERNAGNPPAALRRLDFWLAHLLYAGPVLAGATMLDHFSSFEAFGDVGLAWLVRVPSEVSARHRALALGLLTVGALFLALYLVQAWRAVRAGHQVSRQKVFLLVTTGAVSVYSWGFNSWGEAFFIMNALHAVQYLGLVWAKEGARLGERRLFGRWRVGRAGALALFLGPVLAYGFVAEASDPAFESFWALTLTVSLMHFWYDGFIWSVGRRQV
jgi:hypothetical protein